MVLVLFAITLICSAVVGAVYRFTKDPIEEAKIKKTVEALKVVLPEFDNNPVKDKQTIDGATVYKATLKGDVVGYAVEGISQNGFNGPVKLLVGFDVQGAIVNIAVLEQAETPGLGANMVADNNNLITSFKGKKPAEMTLKVKQDGGDVDALTAATISSRAYTEAVASAAKVFQTASAQ